MTKLIKVCLALILAISGLLVDNSSYFNSILAQSNTKPKRIRYIPTPPPRPSSNGTPTARNAAGSRGICPEIFSLGGNSGYTLTVSEYPTFWFYIPYSADEISNIEFELQYETGEIIDTILVTLPTNSSLIYIRLNKPLISNQNLLWYLTFKCRASSSSDFKQGFIKGLVQRILVPYELNRQLSIAQAPLERIFIYAENGIWYDTLTELLTQPDLQEFRRDFFKEVGLEDVSYIP